MRFSHLFMAFLLSLLGCATAAPIAEAPASGGTRGAGTQVSVSLTTRVSKEQAWRPVRSNDTLHSGDELAIEVESSQPVYVYLARASGSGSLVPLFSNEDRQQSVPSAPLRIPAVEGALRLGTQTGKEDLRVVASLRPLTSEEFLQQAIAHRAENLRDPPPVATDNKRDPYARRVMLGASGVSVVQFSFLHE